jgi:RimJ/RimL family protein N-acetyltransferase
VLTLDTRVETERLVLRGFRPGDLDAVHVMQSDPEVVRYVPWPVRTREESAAWIAERTTSSRLAAQDDYLTWALARRDDDEVVGSLNAWYRSVEHGCAEIGFVLSRHAQGHGYGTEGLRALLDLLFDALPLHRVVGRADARNTASSRLMARVGMRREAHFREDEFFKGEWTDTVVHAVLREEWRRLRAG